MYLTEALVGLGGIQVALASYQYPNVSTKLQSILNQEYQAPLYTYPTSLTQGIVPKGIHSHNDYWRPVPVFTALSVGCISIEADVWLVNGTLYIGHETGALTTARTFDSLYIQPLLSILKSQNPTTAFNSGSKNGVFDTASSQTLYLFVDVKTDGPTTFPAVVKALGPLRDGGWLTTLSNGTVTQGAITVVGTGNTPLDQVQGVSPRDYFYDGPLPDLNGAFSNITSQVSPIASTDFAVQFGTISGTGFNSSQLALLRQQIATAHGKGIKVRYWDQPAWPISTRNGIWRTLQSEGADFINADDVISAAGFSDQDGYW
jgi:hypothetical protein